MFLLFLEVVLVLNWDVLGYRDFKGFFGKIGLGKPDSKHGC